MNRAQIRWGTTTVGNVPRVVGTVSAIDALRSFNGTTDCDIVEIRLDEIGARHADWLAQAERIDRIVPTLLTIRLQREGGRWARPEAARAELFLAGIARLSAIDIECDSALAETLSQTARAHNKVVVASYHNFQTTPDADALRAITHRAARLGSVVKLATMIARDEDVATLEGLFAQDWPVPLCVIGLGDKGTHTRTLFPSLGSCLTYGYLDKPVAPGQVSARELRAQLRGGS